MTTQMPENSDRTTETGGTPEFDGESDVAAWERQDAEVAHIPYVLGNRLRDLLAEVICYEKHHQREPRGACPNCRSRAVTIHAPYVIPDIEAVIAPALRPAPEVRCPTCLLVREEPDEPIQPGDYYTVAPSPSRCPSCNLVPQRDSEGARRVAAARAIRPAPQGDET